MHRGGRRWRVTAAAVAMLVMAACSTGGGAAGGPGPGRAGPPTTVFGSSASAVTAADPSPTTTVAAGPTDPWADPAWVAAENAKAGSENWHITGKSPIKGDYIEGYASAVSATSGDTVTLFVTTTSPTFTVDVYRMGYYGGKRGRLLLSTAPAPGGVQAAPVVDRHGTAEARWQPSQTITVDGTWPPGAYLMKLVSSGGASNYIPLTVRDDNSQAALLLVDAVTTWQAYNDWGACSLYKCLFYPMDRATIVSFNRPYFEPYGRGSADFLDHELPLIALAEATGMDVTYVTDVDLDLHPMLTLQHRAVLSLGHDEYYSTRMRAALETARDNGVNLAFLGANAVYRKIRFEPDAQGNPDRVMVNYRSPSDPIRRTEPDQVTVEWRYTKPENSLIGVMYECAGMNGSLRVTDASNWVYDGTGVKNGDVFENVIGPEYDRAFRDRNMPETLEVLAHSPVTCGGGSSYADMAYYTAPSGAGVFATATIKWICALDAGCGVNAAAATVVQGVTLNVLDAFAAGPAGLAHPATPNTKGLPAGPRSTPTTSSGASTTGPTQTVATVPTPTVSVEPPRLSG